MRELLSLIVTTMNNAATLRRCLESAAWADDIVVLDSGSTDATLSIAAEFGARVFHEPFKGYAAQKQSAIDKARHRWTLLLDADEALADDARVAIETALAAPQVAGFRLPRRRQVFWTFNHAGVRLNTHLRLFDRARAHERRSGACGSRNARTRRDAARSGVRALRRAGHRDQGREDQRVFVGPRRTTSAASAGASSPRGSCSIRACSSCASTSANAGSSTAGPGSSMPSLRRIAFFSNTPRCTKRSGVTTISRGDSFVAASGA